MILDVLLICITMIIIVYMLTSRGDRHRYWGGWGGRPWWGWNRPPVVYGGGGHWGGKKR